MLSVAELSRPVPTGQSIVKPAPGEYTADRRTPATGNTGEKRTIRGVESPVLQGFIGAVSGVVVCLYLSPGKQAPNRNQQEGRCAAICDFTF